MSTAFQLNHSPLYTGATIAAQPITAPKSHRASSDITELVLTKHSPDAKQLLLPMLAHLSQDSERWITWICDHKVDRNKLADYGVDTDKIRILYSNQPEDTHWILWEALKAGTSHTVIAAPGDLNDEVMQHFENAAQRGNSRGLFIRYR